MATPTISIIIPPLTSAGKGVNHQKVSPPTSIIISADYPSGDDLRFGVTCANGSITGNMTEPSTIDVKSGVQYGANGTEFTGTYAGGGKKNFGFNF